MLNTCTRSRSDKSMRKEITRTKKMSGCWSSGLSEAIRTEIRSFLLITGASADFAFDSNWTIRLHSKNRACCKFSWHCSIIFFVLARTSASGYSSKIWGFGRWWFKSLGVAVCRFRITPVAIGTGVSLWMVQLSSQNNSLHVTCLTMEDRIRWMKE